MIEIPVTQFLRPNAEKRYLYVEVSDEAGHRWKQEIEPLGLRFTAEVIPGGDDLEDQVCVCLEDPDLGDYRLALSPNIPNAPIVRDVESLLIEFDKFDYTIWVKSLTDDEED
jgi:hypothetical protein